MNDVESLDILRKNLEAAKEQLKNVDSDIKRITGRDPAEDRYLRKIADAKSRRLGFKSSISVADAKNPSDLLSYGYVNKSRKNDSARDLKKTLDDDIQVSLASSVIRVSDTRSRQDAVKGLKKSDKDRGRRMLGILQGTLKQFQEESAAAVKKPQMERRRQVDAKLEARAKEERESLRRERAQLFRVRREHFLEISLLQQKMRLLKEFEIWKEKQEKMKGFCRTSKSPYIFYRPKILNEETKWRIELTGRAIDDLIARRRRKLEIDFEETLKARRRLISTHESDPVRDGGLSNSKISLHDHEMGDEFGEQWSLLSDSNVDSKLSSSIMNKTDSTSLKSQFPLESYSNTNQRDLETGELSDTSETFAIEADEPQLMEEEHHPPSVIDTQNSRRPSSRFSQKPTLDPEEETEQTGYVQVSSPDPPAKIMRKISDSEPGVGLIERGNLSICRTVKQNESTFLQNSV